MQETCKQRNSHTRTMNYTWAITPKKGLDFIEDNKESHFEENQRDTKLYFKKIIEKSFAHNDVLSPFWNYKIQCEIKCRFNATKMFHSLVCQTLCDVCKLNVHCHYTHVQKRIEGSHGSLVLTSLERFQLWRLIVAFYTTIWIC